MVAKEMNLMSEATTPRRTTQIIGRLASVLRSSDLSLTQICQHGALAASTVIGDGSSEIWLLDDHTPRLRLVASSSPVINTNQSSEQLGSLPLNRRSIQGRTALHRDAVFVSDSLCLPLADQQRLRLVNGRGVAVLPLVAKRQAVGVLCVMHAQSRVWNQHDRLELGLLADLIALALHNLLLAEREEALRHYEENLVAAVSHELRTPLTSVLGYLSLFQRRLTDDLQQHKAQHYLHVIMHQAKVLSAIVDELLDVGLIQNDQLVLKLEPVDPTTLFDRALDETRKRYPNRLIRMETALPPAQQATWDTARVAQIVRHLLKNAIVYSPDHTAIEVSLGYTPSEVRVAVRDYGFSINPSHQDRIFKRFWRGVDNSFHKTIYGLGIGLYIGQALAAAHGGHLLVQSNGVPGQGSIFTLTLPWQSPSATALIKSKLE